MKRSLPLVLFLLASACASVPPPSSEPVHVVLVGTTDVHGWFAGHVEAPPGGGEGVAWGGIPVLASYVEALRVQNPGRVIVVDSGDMWQGTLESNTFEGEPVVHAYNALGYAAAAVGNHEFDFGPVGAVSTAAGPADDPLGTVKRNAALARFPFLAANLIEKKSGRTPSWVRPYTLVRAGGATVGIIGLANPGTPNITIAANVTGLEFTDPVPAAIAAAAELRARGADAVVAIAHFGGRCGRVDDPHDLGACEAGHDAPEFLERLPAGTIDALFAGHTHSPVRHYIRGVPVVQALHYGREFSTLDLWIDPEGGRVTRTDIRPHTMICSYVYSGTDQCDPRTAPAGAKLEPRTFAGRRIVPDQRVVTAVHPFLERMGARRRQKLGIRTAGLFARDNLAESPLGNLLADALRAGTGADIGLMNSGGIRNELPAGEITYGDLYAVSPFDNHVAVATLTGRQITEILRATTTGVRGIMQVSGLQYTYDAAKDEEKPMPARDRLIDVRLADGTPLDPDKLYRVAMPDFMARGGDDTQEVMESVPAERITVDYSRPLRDALAAALRRFPQPLIPSTEGRITVRNAPTRFSR